MNDKIELYRGPERTFFGTIPFLQVVRKSLQRLLGWDLSRTLIQILVLDVPEDTLASDTPDVDNLVPEFGYTDVRVYREGVLVYRHPHPLHDVVTDTLRTILRERYPEEQQWGFRLDLPGIPRRSTVRPTPYVQGSVTVRSYTAGEQPGFAIRRIAEPEPPVKTLRDFGVTTHRQTRDTPVTVLLPATLEHNLCALRPLSQEVEEGGFLIGRVYRDGDRHNAYLLEMTDAPAAAYTGASLLHFTFTGDSFAAVKQTLRRSTSGERLLGWYHTHLFAATDELGLSSVDLDLHFGTFTISWQLAGLINLEGQKRTLRFYVRQGNTMVLCPYMVIDERHRYHLTSD